MQNICKKCSATFEILKDEEEFLKKIGWKYGDFEVHPALPVYCPDCRLKARTCHRNERYFYKRKSSLSNRDIVSLYHPNAIAGRPYQVYALDEWQSDKFDPIQYGRDFDFSRPFFDQFAELQKNVPRQQLMTLDNENSDYSSGTAYCKNCYLINSSEYCEDCYYGKLFQSCKSCVDCSYIYNSELCYECLSVTKCYGCQHLYFSQNCSDCHLSSNLIGCKNCFLCTNLRQKEYHFENKPLPKAEYEKRVNEILGSYAKMEEARGKLLVLRQGMINKYANIVNSENSTGDHIENSRNCLDCYDVNDSQDCRYVTVGVNVKDNYDCSNMYIKPELAYETLGTIGTYCTAYCLYVFHSQNLLYCDFCFHSSDLFACSGLTRKKYCIFNKQYTQEEYEKLVPKIIDHMKKSAEWGKFFPPDKAPFGYNESVAHEYFPLTKDEALAQGYLWRNLTDAKLEVKKTIPASLLPDTIAGIPDEVTEWAITSEISKRPFKIIKQELDFYRRQNLPIPHLHPDERYDRRLQIRNPRKLWKRNCAKCGCPIDTTYQPSRPERIFCEDCYLKEVY